MGYVEPSHRWKGKQQWLNSDNELYSTNKEKKKNISMLMYYCSSYFIHKHTSN